MFRHARTVRALIGALAATIAAAAPLRAQEATPPPAVPVARITSPIADQQIRGAALIQGTAVAPNFLRYEVAYAVASPDPVWITIGGAQQAVANGTLATWNTRALADGEYILRLQVYATDGNFFAVVTGLKISNAAAAAVATQQPALNANPARTTAPNEFDAARDVLGALTDAAERIPAGFLRGVRIAAIALGALLAYAVAKSVLLAALRRFFHRPIDYSS
jgi:hypothetical protein